jgi:hypothetical protein
MHESSWFVWPCAVPGGAPLHRPRRRNDHRDAPPASPAGYRAQSPRGPRSVKHEAPDRAQQSRSWTPGWPRSGPGERALSPNALPVGPSGAWRVLTHHSDLGGRSWVRTSAPLACKVRPCCRKPSLAWESATPPSGRSGSVPVASWSDMVVSLGPHQLGRERLLAKPECYGLARTGARGKRRETVMKAKPASDLSQSPRFVFSFVNTSCSSARRAAKPAPGSWSRRSGYGSAAGSTGRPR